MDGTRSLAILHRRPDVGAEAFERYWLETHSGFVVRVPGLARFAANRVLASSARGLRPDAIGELWWDRPEAAGTGFDSPEGRAALRSGARIIDQPRNASMVLDRLGAILPDGAEPPAPAVRSLAILHRRPDVGAEAFERYWRDEHAARVLAVPGVLAFATNRVRACAAADLDPDYVGEVWWRCAEARAARVSAPEYEALLASGAAIIDQPRNASIVLRELGTFAPQDAEGAAR